jgi:hypothetical protein
MGISSGWVIVFIDDNRKTSGWQGKTLIYSSKVNII